MDCRSPRDPITWRKRKLSRAVYSRHQAQQARKDEQGFLHLLFASAVNFEKNAGYPWPWTSSFSGCVDDTLEGVFCTEGAC